MGALALLDEREHDAEHAVLVGRRGFLGVDVGVLSRITPEWAGLDLELLVDRALGLLNRRSPLITSSRPEISRLTADRSRPPRSAFTTALGDSSPQ